MSMPRRVRLCERRQPRRSPKPEPLPPQQTCETPGDYEWRMYAAEFKEKFGHPPSRPLEGESKQRYLSRLPDYEGNEPPPGDGCTEIADRVYRVDGPPKRVAYYPPQPDEHDPYEGD